MQKADSSALGAPLQIWKGTRLSTLLMVQPEALDVRLAFDPSLSFLRDKEARKIAAHRYCLEDVSRRAGRSFEELLEVLEGRAGVRRKAS